MGRKPKQRNVYWDGFPKEIFVVRMERKRDGVAYRKLVDITGATAPIAKNVVIIQYNIAV